VLPPDRRSAHRARELVEAACRGLSEERVDTARLLVSELVANAVVHGTGEVLLTVVRRRRSLRVEVSDGSTRLPVLAEGGTLRESGAGLRLVDALASGWGTGARTDGRPGKLVWFTLT
jgi:anti-sigma regulatory factor (Ser/Thr protein kinase)